MGRNSGVVVADGTGVAVELSVAVALGIVEVVVIGGEVVGTGAGVLPQPVNNKTAIVKRTSKSLI